MEQGGFKKRFLLPTADDLKQLRIQKGFSQAQLASLAGPGFSQPLIARIEKGTINPPLSKVKRLLDVLHGEHLEGQVTAKDIAVRPVISVEKEMLVAKAIETMGTNGVSQVPVCDAFGKVIGSLTEKKMTEMIIEKGRDALKLPVSSIMEAKFPEIGIDSSIAEIQEKMMQSAAILVMDGGAIFGILTKTDLLRYFSALK
nr:CBS domain-containing protein [Candidatus Sigynarchaeota archaeon]